MLKLKGGAGGNERIDLREKKKKKTLSMLRSLLELNDVLFQTDFGPRCRQKQPHKALLLRLHLAWE